MNSKRMLLRLLRLGLLSLFFVHQTTPALSIIEESVKELIVERRVGYYDLFTVKMKTDRTCNSATCTSLGAHHLFLLGSSCSCRCLNYQPYTFLSSIQRCADTTQVHDFGGELSIHHISIHQIPLSLYCSQCMANKTRQGYIFWRTPNAKSVSIKHGLRTADCGLGIKHGLRIEYKRQTRYKTRTTDYVYKNSFRKVKLRETESGLA